MATTAKPRAPKKLIRAYQDALSPRALAVLAKLAEYEHEESGELVQERGEVWFGCERTSPRIVHALLRACAVSEDQFSRGPLYRYTINETGKAILKRRRAPVSSYSPRRAPAEEVPAP